MQTVARFLYDLPPVLANDYVDDDQPLSLQSNVPRMNDIMWRYVLPHLTWCDINHLQQECGVQHENFEFEPDYKTATFPMGEQCKDSVFVACLKGHKQCVIGHSFHENKRLSIILHLHNTKNIDVLYPRMSYIGLTDTDVSTLDLAIRCCIVYDHVKCLEVCLTFDTDYTDNATQHHSRTLWYMLCARYGALKCMKYLYENIGIPLHEDTEAIAKKFKQIQILKYLNNDLHIHQKSADYID